MVRTEATVRLDLKNSAAQSAQAKLPSLQRESAETLLSEALWQRLNALDRKLFASQKAMEFELPRGEGSARDLVPQSFMLDLALPTLEDFAPVASLPEAAYSEPPPAYFPLHLSESAAPAVLAGGRFLAMLWSAALQRATLSLRCKMEGNQYTLLLHGGRVVTSLPRDEEQNLRDEVDAQWERWSEQRREKEELCIRLCSGDALEVACEAMSREWIALRSFRPVTRPLPMMLMAELRSRIAEGAITRLWRKSHRLSLLPALDERAAEACLEPELVEYLRGAEGRTLEQVLRPLPEALGMKGVLYALHAVAALRFD